MPVTPTPEELNRLVALAQRGDHGAFYNLVVAVQHDLRLVLCGFAPPPEVVEELVQDTLATAWEKLDSYRLDGNFQAWLHTIARNKARSHWRANRRTAQLNVDILESLIAETESELLADEERAESETARLSVCLERLSVQARQLLQRRYVDETPLVVLAREFRKTEQALAALFYRLRSKLHDCMAMERLP